VYSNHIPDDSPGRKRNRKRNHYGKDSLPHQIGGTGLFSFERHANTTGHR
jgi:hypothetical protein